MPEQPALAKAELRQLDADFANEIKPDRKVAVQFNPESLKVTFANQLQTPESPGDQRGTPARQFVGAGTTKLALQIWFDVTALEDGENTENDVRNLTKKVSYFITPERTDDSPPKFVPPAVRFLWGTFKFDGLMDSLEESLEYFSPDGRPLRASMSFSLSQQKIEAVQPGASSGGQSSPPGAAGGQADPTAAAGTKPLTPAPAGASLQSLVDQAGRGTDWQQIAEANGIENPRLLLPGQLIDLNIH